MAKLSVKSIRSDKKPLLFLTMLGIIWIGFQINIFSLIIAVLSAVLWLEYFITGYFLRKTNIDRTLNRNRAFTDQPIKLRYTLKSFFPGILEIEFVTLIEKATSVSAMKAQRLLLKPGQPLSISTELVFSRRGKKDVSSCSIAYKDPLGFFKRWVVYSNPEEVLILPKLMEFESFPLMLRELLPGSKSDFQLLEDPTHIKGIRKYSFDPMNRIHWKISAKMKELYTKEFNFTAISKTILYLDLNLSEEVFARAVWSQMRKNYEEQAILAASSLIRWSHERGNRIDLVVVGKEVLKAEYAKDWVETVELLAIAEGTDTGEELSSVLLEDTEKLTPETTLVIFSLYLTDSILPVLLKARSKCARVLVLIMPYGYRDPRYKPGRSFELLPVDMKRLKEKAALLEKEQILVRIVRDNQSLQEVVREIEEVK
ncbi:hypothetical protein AT15_05220 [Kosmotoga arenicorallina S304]|uniref:Uncharacterized protein n=1 Tax=Kosmotoga arenicorallina S304 TaxID=1453497 RepID=A0A176JUW9_9BACT|nr:DUF58 domain-containing protein [Kosmotoga arenicorallina]OAA27222.1 hypothetical protein AT15_05220 [Kosmotoga arenicorallina S304]